MNKNGGKVKNAKKIIRLIKKTRPSPRLEKIKKLRAVLISRMLLVVFLLIIQLVLMILCLFTINNALPIYFGSGIIISILFLCYLVNRPGKNEFKLAWILPVLIAPFFGITLYFLFKINTGRYRIKKRLCSVKKLSAEHLPCRQENLENLKNFPQIKDLASYLYDSEKFCSYQDTAVKYLSCGEEYFANLLEDLKKAKKFIFIEYFIIEASKILEAIVSVLAQKVKEGVEVRILFDSIGSIALSSRLLKNYFAVYGIQSKVFLKFIPILNTGLNNRDHRKIVSIDGTIAYTGGINITDEYANISSSRFNYWKDTGVRLEGPACRQFTLLFLQLWNLQNKKNETADNFADYTDFQSDENHLSQNKISANSNPYGLVIPYADDAYNVHDIAENIYKYILDNAKTYVHITTPYIIIDNEMISALNFCADRGVEVEIIIPKYADHFISFCVGRTYLKNLLDHNVKIFTYDEGFIHQKTFISDGNIATAGTVNLDYRSLYHHFECGAVIYKNTAIKEMEQDFNLTKLECTQMTCDSYKKTPVHIRVIGWIFRIFAPLM